MTHSDATLLHAEKISVQAADRWLLSQASITVYAGELHVIMGANGAGKSTLLKSLSGATNLTKGSICFQGKPVHNWSYAELATRRAFLGQHNAVTLPFSAYEIIAMGRYAYGKTGDPLAEQQIITTASDITQTTALWPQNYLTLSGGEKQRVQLARVLAQLLQHEPKSLQGKLLLLDEPVTALDIKHQFQLMETVRAAVRGGLAVVCVLHDIGLAMQYATHVHLMKQGQMLYQAPVTAISAAMISETFDMPVSLQQQQGKILVQVYAA